jgi:hypothetical protein
MIQAQTRKYGLFRNVDTARARGVRSASFSGKTRGLSIRMLEALRRVVRGAWQSPALRVFAVTRGGLVLLMFLSLAALPLVTDDVWRGAPDNVFLDGWARWDAGWYRLIALEGYTNKPNEAGQRDTAFFPLYPLLVHLGTFVTSGPIASAVLVSNVALAWALVLLYRLIEAKRTAADALRTIILLSVFPFAFYLGAMYTEAVFLLCTVGAFHYAERKQWWIAALFASCAGATKTVGVSLAAPLLILYLEQRKWQLKSVRADVLATLSPAAGLAAYMVFLFAKFGDPIAFVRAQDAAGWSVRASGFDRLTFALSRITTPATALSGDFHVTDVLNLLAVVWAIPVAIVSFRVLGLAYALWCVLVIVPSLGIWVGFGRYVTTLFPLFAVMAHWLRNDARFVTVAFFWTLLLALLTILYGHFYWVA